jgi:NhaP-type Na+/H+ or K+/H+ antiporter
MGAGLKFDRPLGLRRWSSTWRLLAVVMPLTIGAIAAVAVFVVRPLPGRLALLGSGVAGFERRAISFFGVRGIGSLYYVAYALRRRIFEHSGVVWSTVSFAILLSIVVHGVTATPIMRRINGRRRAVRRAQVVDAAPVPPG